MKPRQTGLLTALTTVAAMTVVTALAGPAGAAPARRPAPGQPTKLDKKQLAVERHIYLAQFYLRRGNDIPGAIKEYKAALAIDPGNIDGGIALSSLYLADRKPKLAVDVIKKLTRSAPRNPTAWLLLAEIQANLRDTAGMAASLAKVLELKPGEVGAYTLMFDEAQARLEAGDASAKADVLAAARKILQYSRGRGEMVKLAERAIVELSGQPIDIAIYDAKAAYSAAFDAAELGKINEHMRTARKSLEKCLQLDPAREECHYQLGLVYASVKASDAYDPRKALAELALAPSLPAAWIQSAILLRASDKNADARAALEKAIALDGRGMPPAVSAAEGQRGSIDPAGATAYVELGVLDKLDGKADAAVERFVAAIDRDPYGAVGDRALDELTKLRPNHPRLVRNVMEGKLAGDVFSSERFKAAVGLMEQSLGGVEPGAPEKAVVEDIVRRLADGSAVKLPFRVSILGAKIVNAFALPDGNVYVTRGMFDLLKAKAPNQPIDASNDILGHILAHELQHVIRRHGVNSAVFQAAVKDASAPIEPAVLTHVTRLQEIDADREGMVMAFLAGYHPRGGIELMEILGQEHEIPQHLDHPTFDERVSYLTEYWTNDVRYAFVSFKLGVAAMDRGGKLEATDMKQAIAAYTEAVDDFKRYRAMLPSLKEACNDLGVAYTKLGVLANSADSPLGRWQTRLSLERSSAINYVGLARDEEPRTRGGGGPRMPGHLREAITQLKEALAIDESYSKARLNLAAAYLAADQRDNAAAMLAKFEPRIDPTAPPSGSAAGRVQAPAGDVTAADIDLIRGIVLAETRDYDQAKAAFERAQASPAAKRAAVYNLARTLELAGKKPEAKAAYQGYARAYPDGPWAKAAAAAAAKL